MENEARYSFTRIEVETMVGRKLSDREWEIISFDIVDAIDFAFDDFVQNAFADLKG